MYLPSLMLIKTKKHLSEMAEMWAKHDHSISSSSKWLYKFTDSLNEQIIDQIQEIRKSMKRIQSLSYAIKIAEQIIDEKNKT